MNETPIDAIKTILEANPENESMRGLLIKMLTEEERFDEAETELKAALKRNPQSDTLKVEMAVCLDKKGDLSGALSIMSSLTLMGDPTADALIFHARLLLKAGEISKGVEVYHNAVEQNAAVADDILARKLGVTNPGDEQADLPIKDGRIRLAAHAPVDANVDIQKSKITFGDVGGMDGLKEEIRMKIIHPLNHKALYESYGKPIGGGILMYGPPGCGKTFIAKATAGEINANFISVGISDVLDMWMGQSERNLHDLFETARNSAPCVLFFDEVDALGASRQDMRTSSGRHLINQFLSELDGVENNNDGVLILAATNAPWHIDNAFRRPGRFDRIIFAPPPDAPARADILRVLLRNKPTDKISYEKLAKKSNGFSGADLNAMLDIAIEGKLALAIKDGIPKPLTTADLVAAAKQVTPSTTDWFSTAKNHVLYSNQSGLYDPIKAYLKL